MTADVVTGGDMDGGANDGVAAESRACVRASSGEDNFVVWGEHGYAHCPTSATNSRTAPDFEPAYASSAAAGP